MEKIWFFDFETRMWTHKACTGGHSSWSFGHAHKRGKLLYAYGTPVPSTEEGLLEVSLLPSNATLELYQVQSTKY